MGVEDIEQVRYENFLFFLFCVKPLLFLSV